jgi:oxygen-independent coproporphyrinogen-3 oxidase
MLGVYISVPFCKAKCSYCNFASGVLGAGTAGAERIDRYVEQVCAEIGSARARAAAMDAKLPEQVDTVYFGGGTPSLLSAEQMRRLFAALGGEFEITKDAEITLECAPGQLGEETLDQLLRLGMNRVSFGVQSFVDAEARAVGRLHTRAMCLAEIERMRAAGVKEINVDLIAGLPQQTAASWRESVEVVLESAVPHVSVYMLEVDEDSRLGREILLGGIKYGAGDVPRDDAIAEWYGAACEWLEAGGVMQYEISNFARKGHASRHNVKYWRREPYVGFGLDAHSMLRCGDGAVRWANSDDIARFEVQGSRFEGLEVERIGREKGFEEAMFLGLRMNEGVDMEELRAEFGEALMRGAEAALSDVEEAGLVEREGSRVRLTARGRMVSNEVFSRLLVVGC